MYGKDILDLSILCFRERVGRRIGVAASLGFFGRMSGFLK